MEECEICGRRCEELNKCEIEGSVMYVCPNCAKMGTVIKEEPKSKAYVLEEQPEEEVDLLNDARDEFVDGFNLTIQKNRQRQNLTIKDLAEKLNIKESIMKKIEHGEIVPDGTTKNKLERFFRIKLTRVNPAE
ncbi:MAG: TIGR00270 family protein [Candidatus Nanohalarchaeota archaeon]|nr:MAG: TIGR00270 family protein [Candidatus Nanohaloarchaeota archaeon]